MFEGIFRASEILAIGIPNDVVFDLQSVLTHPDGLVRKEVMYLYWGLREKLGLPHDPSVFGLAGSLDDACPYPTRAALRSVVTLTDEILTHAPDLLLALRYKAVTLLRLGCPTAAMLTLRASTANVDAYADTLEQKKCNIVLARCLLTDPSQQDDALTFCHQVKAEVEDAPAILVDAAHVFIKLGAAQEAEALYDFSIKAEDTADYRRQRAAFYLGQGRYGEAKEETVRAAEKEPWHPETFGLKGQLAVIQSQFTEAAGAFREARRRDPHSLRWQYSLAFAHLGLQEQEESEAIFESALARAELHEQVFAALQDLELLKRARPDLTELGALRERILDRRALLDRLAEEECCKGG
jgi:tetratricopeptide (TPR) repeat protein